MQYPVVLVGPPHDHFSMPSLAISLLMAGLNKQGIKCKALYTNMVFMQEVGADLLWELSDAIFFDLLLERIFAPQAHEQISKLDLSNMGSDDTRNAFKDFSYREGLPADECTLTQYHELESRCATFLKKISDMIINYNPRIIGFSNAFQPLNAMIALAKTIKKKLPGALCVIGGPNCDGEMGAEIARSIQAFDYVFQGEADFTFTEFCLQYFKNNSLPKERLIHCLAPQELDSVAIPDYADFIEQCNLPLEKVALPFESSRGCWWAKRNQCKFCGESKLSTDFRFKSAPRMYNELNYLQKTYPSVQTFLATDSIFPNAYYKDLLSQLAGSDFNKLLMYSTRANLTHVQIVKLRQAGIKCIFAGIESLSTRLLNIMNKGTDALTNLRMMRDCRELGVQVLWNILVGIPGDRAADYEEQEKLIPFIQHLPPTALRPIRLQRFSPFFEDAARYNISEIRPIQGYSCAFPESMDIAKLAYYFEGRYPSESREHPMILLPFHQHIVRWQERWRKPEDVPELSLRSIDTHQWLVKDTRNCAKVASQIIGDADYDALKQCRQGLSYDKFKSNERVERLINFGYLIEVDNKLLSLICETS